MKTHLPETANRVKKQTHRLINDKIHQETESRISYFAAAKPAAIDRRLKELDKEWDIERTLETNGSILLLAGLTLGVLKNKKWLLLPALVGSFCLQHALQGWCPPLEIFRRTGIRTSREIENERFALKTMRGDFKKTAPLVKNGAAKRILKAVEQ